MKLASFAVGYTVSYGIVKRDGIIDAGRRLRPDLPDLASVLTAGALPKLEALQTLNADFPLGDVHLLKPVPNPGKIICVGVNFKDRNAEYQDGSEQPKYPSLFVRYPDSLVAHEEPILRPLESEQLDYEGEIAVIIGRAGRRIATADALSHIAAYTICNEGSVRDWIRHGKFNVTQGKNFERSGALGPWMVTSDELPPGPLRIITRVNGELRQDDTTDHMIFSITELIAYISRFCTLQPADIIVTGTPTGAGARFNPPRYLRPGDVVEVEVSGIGTLRNRIMNEAGGNSGE